MEAKDIIATWRKSWQQPWHNQQVIYKNDRRPALKELFELLSEECGVSSVYINIRDICSSCWPKKHPDGKKKLAWARFVTVDIVDVYNEVFADSDDKFNLTHDMVLGKMVANARFEWKTKTNNDTIENKPVSTYSSRSENETQQGFVEEEFVPMGKPIDLQELIRNGQIKVEDCFVAEALDSDFLDDIGYVATEKLR